MYAFLYFFILFTHLIVAMPWLMMLIVQCLATRMINAISFFTIINKQANNKL